MLILSQNLPQLIHNLTNKIFKYFRIEQAVFKDIINKGSKHFVFNFTKIFGSEHTNYLELENNLKKCMNLKLKGDSPTIIDNIKAFDN